MPKSPGSRSALIALIITGTAFPQQPAPQQPQVQLQVPPNQPPGQVLTLHASSRAVLLDVVVTDQHGHPIHGLKPENFQLFEDDQLQTIASLEEHHAPTATELAAMPPPPALGPNTWSNQKTNDKIGDAASVVFLLDALDTSPQTQSYVRGQLMSYFNSMAPGTQVAIFQLGMQLRLLQGFTSDASILRTAIKERDKPETTPLPNGRGYIAQVFHMDSLDSAMQSLGAYLATWPGRKDLIWFTGRIPRDTYDDGTAMGGALHDSESFFFDYSKATESLVLGQVTVYPIDARGLQTNPDYSAAHQGPPSNDSERRFATRQFFQHADLDDVAEATGGHAFYNTNGIKQAVAEVVETGASFYTISYYPANKQWNGHYRKLKVELNHAPQSGLALEYRHGYYAVIDAKALNPPKPPAMAASGDAPEANGRVQLTHHDAPSPGQVAFVKAMQLGAVDPNQIVFNARVAIDPAVRKLAKDELAPKDFLLNPRYHDHPFRTAQITWNVPGGQLQLDSDSTGKHTGAVEFVAVIVDEQGAVVDTASAEIDMTLGPDSYKVAQASGVEMIAKIAIPEKGSYFLRTGVRDVAAGKSGALEVSTGDIKIGPVTP